MENITAGWWAWFLWCEGSEIQYLYGTMVVNTSTRVIKWFWSDASVNNHRAEPSCSGHWDWWQEIHQYRSLYHDSACEQFWPARTVPIGANSSVELVLLSLCCALFHHMCSDLPWSSVVSLKSLHLLCVSSKEGENWVWTLLLICFLYGANTIPTPLYNSRAGSARGRLFLTAGGLGVFREILVAGRFYVLTLS